jgi:nascent polypeptide-associated complex subunit alpha
MDVRNIQKLMKQMSTEELPVTRADFLLENGKILRIEKPAVTKMQVMGQITYQVTGDAKEVSGGAAEDDVQMVVAGAGCSEEDARKALTENGGDIAAAILKLKGRIT